MKWLLALYISLTFSSAVPASTAHVIVPLADNENQNIVKVNKTLGDGKNLMTNLYWGAMYGARTVLKKSAKFELVGCVKVDESVLERCEFKHRKSGSIAVLEAYAGDKMKASLENFFDLATGKLKTSGLKEKYDSALVVFSGHNGLMDYPWKMLPEVSVKSAKKVAILACQSKSFFRIPFSTTDVSALVVTRSNMAPEGYLLEELLDGYFSEESGAQIKTRVAKAYSKYQKISLKAANGVFDTGF